MQGNAKMNLAAYRKNRENCRAQAELVKFQKEKGGLVEAGGVAETEALRNMPLFGRTNLNALTLGLDYKGVLPRPHHEWISGVSVFASGNSIRQTLAGLLLLL